MCLENLSYFVQHSFNKNQILDGSLLYQANSFSVVFYGSMTVPLLLSTGFLGQCVVLCVKDSVHGSNTVSLQIMAMKA